MIAMIVKEPVDNQFLSHQERWMPDMLGQLEMNLLSNFVNG